MIVYWKTTTMALPNSREIYRNCLGRKKIMSNSQIKILSLPFLIKMLIKVI